MSSLSSRILLTLAYSDQFSHPLTRVEVWQRLVNRQTKDAHVTQEEVERELARLADLGVLDHRGQFYSLAGRKKIISVRQQRQQTATSRFPSVLRAVNYLRWIPWIEAVAITGSLAVGVCREDDDVDFLIITQPHRLWLTRMVVTGLASILGQRRYWWEDHDRFENEGSSDKHFAQVHPSVEGKWCFNMWLDTHALRVSPDKRSVYTAYEVCQAVFVYERPSYFLRDGSQHIEQRFLAANRWVESFLPNFFRERECNQTRHSLENWVQTRLHQALLHRVFELLPLSFDMIGSLIWYPLDALAYVFQRWYMRAKMTIEIVDRKKALFHPRDTRSLVSDGWKKSLQRLIETQATYLSEKNAADAEKNNETKNKKQRGNDMVSFTPDEDLEVFLQEIADKQFELVLVTGVFDIVHRAHRQFLVQARLQGDRLIVGLESDARVKQLKGEDRPINAQEQRLKQLENLGVADHVFVLPEMFSKPSEHSALIKILNPKVLAISEHTPHKAEKEAIMKKHNGNVVVVMGQDTSISSSRLLKEVRR